MTGQPPIKHNSTAPLVRIRKLPTFQPQPNHTHRPFTTSKPLLINPLQNLSHFSAAKEAQFLSKEKRIPREEFHPYLQLIRSSEVDPFAPVPGATPSLVSALRHARSGEADTDTALRLAVSNLIEQIKVEKREKEEILEVLERVERRWKREERTALGFVAVLVGVLAVVVVKTGAVEELVGEIRGVKGELRAFDWGVLGNSSEHLPHLAPRRMSITTSEGKTQMKSGDRNLLSLPEVENRSRVQEVARPVETGIPLPPRRKSESRSLFSRLFWAAPGS